MEEQAFNKYSRRSLCYRRTAVKHLMEVRGLRVSSHFKNLSMCMYDKYTLVFYACVDITLCGTVFDVKDTMNTSFLSERRAL